MRISTQYQYEMYSSGIDSAQQRLVAAQQQESTGLKINQASDDPSGTIQLLNMQGVQSQLNQFQTNLSNANTNLGLTDNALSTASSVMQSANTLALQAAGGTLDSQSLQGISSQIDELQQQLLSVANQQNGTGEYLFAGQKTDQAPYSVSSGNLVYSGDGNSINVPVGPNSTIATNIPGTPLFEQAYQALQSLKADIASGNTQAISNNDVTAIQNSTNAITDARGTVGARSQEVQSLTNDNERRISELTTSISNVQDVNVAQAATNYAQAQTAYQSALNALSQAESLSLSGFLSSTNA